MNLFDLFVSIKVDDQATKGIKDVEDTAEKASKGGLSKFVNKLGKGVQVAGKVAVGAITAVTGATIALGAGFIKSAGDVAQYGDNIDKMSQKMGLSAEAYQEWDFIMQHSGTSMETLKAGMKTLANAVDTGNEAFERLGITQSDIASMNQEELFAKTIEQLQKVDNETERTYLAGQLLGRGATELGALLNTSAEDTEAMKKQVHELGGVMSNEAVKAAAAYQDSLQNMQVSLSGLKNNLMSQFLPSMVTVMDGLSLIFSGQDGGIEKISKGVEDLSSKILSKIPDVIKVGAEIVKSLGLAIIENLPVLVKNGISVIESFVSGITENSDLIVSSVFDILGVFVNGAVKLFPKIISLGLGLIVTLSNGIVKALREDNLMQSIIDVVNEIVKVLTDREQLNSLIDASLTLIIEIANGLMYAIPQLVDAVVMIVDKLTVYLLAPDNLAKLINAGIRIIVAIAGGIISAIPTLLESAITIVGDLANEFVTADWGQVGKDIISGILVGLKNAWYNITDWVSGKYEQLTGTFGGWGESWFGGNSSTYTYVNGSHAGGLSYVPFDGYIAELHKGERVLTANEAQRYNGGNNYTSRTDVSVKVGIDDGANAMGLARALYPLLKIVEKEVYA